MLFERIGNVRESSGKRDAERNDGCNSLQPTASFEKDSVFRKYEENVRKRYDKDQKYDFENDAQVAASLRWSGHQLHGQ